MSKALLTVLAFAPALFAAPASAPSLQDLPAQEADACDGALSAVETMCRQGRKDLVRSFTSAGDGSGPRLSGASLRYGAKPGANGYDATLAVLESAR